MATSSLGVCCLTLASLGPGKVAFPDTIPYQSSQESYFAGQNSELQPLCVVSPESAEEVSSIVTSLVVTASALPAHEQAGCHFAVRSGGHNSFAGASNIDQGVTIDLRALNDVQIASPSESDDDHPPTVFVGTGATWGEVYALLDPAGLPVAGGRAAQVGVGGLTLEGGISYFSPRYGWTCDNVVGVEIVLANGSIVHLDEAQHLDTLAALRGGGSNFGVVTGFELRAFHQGPIYGGHVYYGMETIDAQLRAFAELSDPIVGSYDEYASLITSFGFAGGQGAAVVNSMVYTGEQRGDGERPPVYDPLFDIPQLFSTVRVAPLHEVATEQGSFSQSGKRQLGIVTTHDSTVPMLNATYLRWNASLTAVQDVSGIVWSISLEPLPAAIYARAPTRNAMGLSDSEGSLVVTVLSATWDEAADDARVEEAARMLFAGIEADAHALDAYHPFVYLNYAAQWQDPIASYGRQSVEKLQRISQELDPKGVFRQMVPGFKIPR
ncbi:oxidoreductase, FAD-binding protein [Aspergillus steynii IBT 23096]|uniref:Oxidoreductase, FAD-binding protein n=1 Tax=Aspergillus steynii IBT 23096 TaxID=1392250 RepID=A0A2I2FZL3_9EURO|nr:oxidoreductase, FAD-binding protein [Aspergillus steynii IBT 23096]PLB46016.1 oxidoreductase, FAD-binding protein [Aspergillus steynii IBT 23096]